ncbi:MAG: hypothetical protein COA58_11800 [Bacteroidetes bacterium]|nr:MAG: hypothetical protein COA58_11800 [Bacteroidota bacterium]
MKLTFNKYKKHLLAILVFAVLTYAYMPPVLSGKAIQQGDVVNFKGSVSETDAYYKKEGKTPLWTNAIFGGMPTYQISTKGHSNPVKVLMKPSFHHPFNKLFIGLICAYIMFLAFKVEHWLAIIGAFAFTYTTGNLIFLEAGHNTKMQAIAYAPLVLAGLKFLLNKRYLLGSNILAVGIALELVSNHIQISFYLAIMVTIWMIAEFITHLKNKDLSSYFKVVGISLLLALLGIAISSPNILLTKEYSESTIRGQSDLTISKGVSGVQVKENSGSGLDYNYAFQWSNGWQDVMAIIIPNYAGSGGVVDLGKNSAFEGKLNKKAIKNFPFAYWGELPFTVGPVYLGASVFLLFILAFIFIRGPIRWWILIAFILSLVMSMGKNNFAWFNDFLFNHFPLYNKFRVPSMSLTLGQWCVPLLAIVGLSHFIKSTDKERLQKSLKFSGIIVGAFLVLLTFMSSMFTDFSHKVTDPITGNVLKDFDKDIYDQYKIETYLLEEARSDLIQSDGLRSLFFAGTVFLLLWLFIKNKVKKEYLILGIGLAILVDLWSIDKRYLNNEDFVKKRVYEKKATPSAADLAILTDTSYYRVLDVRTSNVMSNSKAALFHKSIGGYHPAKLRRYQELYDWHIVNDIRNNSYENSSVLNMLNTKYIIGKDQKGADLYRINSNNLGHAWFVNNINTLKNADSVILALATFNPKSTAILEATQSDVSSKQLEIDSSASISLISYHPDKMIYKSNSIHSGFAVFSEIFYKDGWVASINGNPATIENANFVLRGLSLPKGENEIIFSFEPRTYSISRGIMLGGNTILYLLLIGSLFFWIKKEFFTKSKEARA